MAVLTDDDLFGPATATAAAPGILTDDDLFGPEEVSPPWTPQSMDMGEEPLVDPSPAAPPVNPALVYQPPAGVKPVAPAPNGLASPQVSIDDPLPEFAVRERGGGLRLRNDKYRTPKQLAEAEAWIEDRRQREKAAGIDPSNPVWQARHAMDQEGLNFVGRGLRTGVAKVGQAIYGFVGGEDPTTMAEGISNLEEASTLNDPWLQRQVQGAISSLTTSTLASTMGGYPAIAYTFATTTYDQAKLDALKGGATEEEARKMALANAGLELGVMTAFQVAGFGGQEKAILEKFRGWSGKEFLKQTAAELTEEEITSLGQMVTADMSPEGITRGKTWETFRDTFVQTVGTMGLVGGLQRIRQFVEEPTVRNAMKAKLPPESTNTKAKREKLAEGMAVRARSFTEALAAAPGELSSGISDFAGTIGAGLRGAFTRGGAETQTTPEPTAPAVAGIDPQTPTEPVQEPVAPATTDPSQAVPTQTGANAEVDFAAALDELGWSPEQVAQVDPLAIDSIVREGLSPTDYGFPESSAEPVPELPTEVPPSVAPPEAPAPGVTPAPAAEGVSDPWSGVSDWMASNLRPLADIAEKNGVADKIEELAANRQTAKQIAKKLGIDEDMVVAVRINRGIPSMSPPGVGMAKGPAGESQEFTDWVNNRAAKKPEIDLSGMGGAIAGGQVDSFYDGLLDSLNNTGKVPKAERTTNIGVAWEAVKDSGVTPEGFVERLREAQPDTSADWAKFVTSMRPKRLGDKKAVEPVVPAEPVAELPPLWEMSRDEIEQLDESAREQDKTLLQRLFGVEGAKKYQANQRRANNPMQTRELTAAASKVVEEMEDALTEDQRNELYGINLPDHANPEAIKPYRDALWAIDDTDADSLGHSIGFQLTRLGEQSDPNEMNSTERVAYAVLREAWEIADKRGFDRAAVSKAAIRRAAGRFSDPEDALFMLRRFIPDAPAPPKPKRLGDKKPVEPAVEPAPPKTKHQLTLEEMQRRTNERNIKTNTGLSPREAESWLRDAITRRPSGVNSPQEVASWIEKGFDNQFYWKHLKETGRTLPEAVEALNAPAPPKKRLGDKKPARRGDIESIESPGALRERSKQIVASGEFQDGDRVRFVDADGSEKTGVVRGTPGVLDDARVDINVDQKKSAGGVPIGRIAHIMAGNVTLLERPQDHVAPASNEPPQRRLASWITKRLDDPSPIGRDEFFAAADREYGGTRAEGKYGDSEAYDALESAANQWIKDNIPSSMATADEAKRTVALLEDLGSRLPKHKARTGEKDTLQQFSTPPAYAYVAAWAANLQDGDVVLEPSAGTGGIAIHAVNPGVKVYGNEIDEARAELLRKLPLEGVFTEDAERIAGILKNKMPAPTVVLMNPPFSRAGRRLGDKMVPGTDRKHIDEALRMMPENGRLVAIIGAGLHGRGKAFDNWMGELPYQVRADVEIGRDVYKGYGTTFPTRLLVIDKTPRTGGSEVTGSVETLPEAIDLLEGVRNDRQAIGRQEQAPAAPVGRTGKPSAGQTESGQRPERTSEPSTGDSSAGQQAGSSAVSGERVSSRTARSRKPDDGLGTEGDPRDAGQPGVESGRTDEKQVATDSGRDARGEPARQPAAANAPTADPGNVDDVAVERTKRTRKKELGESTYEAYQPTFKVKGSQKHPGSLVESAAMAAIEPPPANYSPKIPAATIKGYKLDDGTPVGISDVQLEAVVYAGAAHDQTLPDGRRRGFMIGDGTGVGKAREISGIILDNWLRGRRKAVWVSKNAKLYEPGRDEWKRVGGDPEKMFAHSGIASGVGVDAKEGIIFTTYSTLRESASAQATAAGNSKTRVDQIVDWLGPDFDGVIIFDEAHEMGSAIDRGSGLGKKKASAKSLAGVDLQDKLPNARVVYLSATSATEVANLAYATRLGLWGEGTPFPNREQFVDKITAGGVAAMEKVAADMKAMGMYLARNIAFNDGTAKGTVTYDRIEHALTPDQHRAYDKMAEAWQIVLSNMSEALNLTDGAKSGQAVSRARSNFWSANQRFWNQVITAMQTPSAIKQIEKSLKEGHSAVVQLTSTNEAAQKRALAGRGKDEDLDDLDLSPRYILMDYIERSFPTTAYEEYVDDNGNTQWRPVKDSEGNVVHDPQAVEMKERLLDQLGSLQVANRGAMDMIIDHFGVDAVAEVTGRSERIIIQDGKQVRQKRSERSGKADIAAFMDGRKRILIFSEAGGTGASYHADLTRKNQEPRDHILLQPGWKADAAVQGLGRTHRSNQAQAPKYFLVSTNLKGQKRFISTIARRLGQLGALTKGERKAGEQGVFSAADNLESTEAREALHQLYMDIHHGLIPTMSGAYLNDSLGLQLTDKDGNLKADLPPITQFMNRVLSLPVEQQNAVFDEFQKRLDVHIEQATAAGTLDQGMETLRADKIEKKSEQVVHRDPSGAETKHVIVKVSRKTKPKSWDETHKQVQTRLFTDGSIRGYVRSKKSGKAFIAEDPGVSTQDKYGNLTRKVKLHSPIRIDYTTESALGTENWEIISESEAKKNWNEQLATVPEMHEEDMHILSGVLLPIWDRLPDTNVQVKRLLTDDGEQILGRVIHSDEIRSVLKKLGASMDAPKLSPAEAIDVVNNGGTITLSNDWEIKRSRVEGDWTIEIVGPDYSHNEELNRHGVFSRRVDYRTRYFVPVGDNSADVLAKVVKSRPIADVTYPRERSMGMADAMARKTIVDHPTKQKLSQRVGSVQEKEGIAAEDIIKTWERMFNIPIRSGQSKRLAGLYKYLAEVVRVKEKHIANLAVAAHEIAHHIDKKTGVSKGGNLPDHLRNELAGLDYEPKARVFEGWAEFIRHWITEEDAGMVAPAFNQYFEREWLPAHPEIAKQLRAAQKHAREYADQSVFQRVRSAMGSAPGDDLAWAERFKRKAKNKLLRFYANMWNNTFLASDLDERLEKKKLGGVKLERAVLAYRMADRAASARALQEGVFDLETGEQISKKGGYWDRVRKHLKNDAEVAESASYAHARHTLFMADKKPGYNTGMSVEDAQAIVDYVAADPDKLDRYNGVADTISSFAHELLDMAVRAGRFPRAEQQKIEAYYGDNYFPLWRVKPGLLARAFGGKGYFDLPKLVRGRSKEGSGAKVMNPHDAIQSMTVEFYRGAAKARVARLLVEKLDPELGGAQGMGSLMEKLDPKMLAQKGQIWEFLDTMVEAGVLEEADAKAMKIAAQLLGKLDSSPSAKNREWFYQRHGLDEDASEAEVKQAAESEPDAAAQVILWRPDYRPSPGKKIAVYYDRNGKPSLYQFDDFMYDSFVSLGDVHLNVVGRFLEQLQKPFKAGAVTMSTAFAAQNPISDIQEYWGRAREAKGKDVFIKPFELGGQYVAYKVAQKFGYKAKPNPLFDLFDEMGGNMYTAVGQDMTTLKRQRGKELSFSAKAKAASVLAHPTEGFAWAVNQMQGAIAVSDVPARLAEMQASIKNAGYVREGDRWRDLSTGDLLTRLPEKVRIDAIYAAGEATTNFARRGNWYRYTELLAPLSNAGFQALRRRAKLLGNLKNLGDGTEKSREAARYAAYLSIQFAAGMLYYLMRGDDDDYVEGESWLFGDYFTTGGDSPGETGLRFRKARDAASIVSIGEAAAAKMFGEGAPRGAKEALLRDLASSVPAGGGLGRAVFEAFVTNRDYYRDSDVEPSYMDREKTPSEYRQSAATTGASKSLGWYTGRYMGISPMQVDHVLAGATGGFYRRLAQTWDRAMNNDLESRDVPFVRGFAVNRHQAQSASDFYDQLGEAAEAAERAELDIEHLGDTPERQADAKKKRDEADRLDGYGKLMTDIRVAERDAEGKRTFEFEPYIVGLARDALGREPLESNPNPLGPNGSPQAIHAIILKRATLDAAKGILSEGRPQQTDSESKAEFDERTNEWKHSRDVAAKWLIEHKDSPAVKQALTDARKEYREKLMQPPKRSEVRRRRIGDKAPVRPPMSYAEKVRIWRENKAHAEKMLKAAGG